MSQVWLNGACVATEKARIDPSDRGFLLGDGAFETMRFEAGEIRRWPRHRARLQAALAALEITPPDWRALESAASELCRAQGLDAAVVRLTVSRGALGGGMTAQDDVAPTVLMTARALPQRPTSLSAQIIDDARRDARNLSSRHKLTGYADMLGARRAAQRAGADMALVLSSDGSVSSADSANLFWVKQGVVFTPSLACGCLPGTTRIALIEALKAREVHVQEGEYAPSDMFAADWVFVTNAVSGLTPLSRIDAQTFTLPTADTTVFQAVCDAAF